MSNVVEIDFDEKQWDRTQTILSEFPDEIGKAVRPAFRKGIHAFREKAKTGITGVYSISRGNMQKEGQVRAEYYDVAATLTYSGKKVNLIDFNGSSKVRSLNAHVRGQQIIGGGGLFPHAFIAQMPDSGHVGTFERTGKFDIAEKGRYKDKLREQIREIVGVAEAQMVGRSDIYEPAETEAKEAAALTFDECISAVINRY